MQPVSALVASVCALWGEGAQWHTSQQLQPHEATILALDASKARARLAWRPRLTLDEALSWTTRWYKAFYAGGDMREYTVRQIREYQEVVT